ncbi:MAG TPA: hypothetical protein VH722_00220 [Alphaproteobacteria bacterium]|jgi:hypothetical protein|nr:hypothetical protein [Alphaproteobacteria bacterium]
MKYSIILAAALLALPAAASEGHDRCSPRDLNGSWVYYSFAPSDNYTITCSLQVSSGSVTGGSCVQSGGQTLTASGSISIATAMTHHQNHHMQKPLKSVDHTACSITGTITYPEINMTETLTNLTIAHDKDEIVGVGTNGFHLISVNFVRNGDGDDNDDNGHDGPGHH